MPIPREWIERWRRVDREPETYIDYLDRSRNAQRLQAELDPAHHYAFLQVTPGQHVLDVGCGTGDTLRRLAPLIGPTGRLVGVDSSTAMIGEARARAAAARVEIELLVGDAMRLPLESATFDRVTAFSVLQHLDEPAKAVAEMARVARPGGRVSVTEHDWDTLVIAAEPLELSRQMARTFADALPSGTVGRRLGELFLRHDLIDVTIEPTSVAVRVCDEGDAIDRAFGVELAREAALPAGIVDEHGAAAWREQLLARSRDGRFFLAFTVFTATGTRR